ncbi:Uncharacterised protein [Burkholderia pseudomallei]|nr:Uncharacterised protein [Burkholderia pseudomallei]
MRNRLGCDGRGGCRRDARTRLRGMLGRLVRYRRDALLRVLGVLERFGLGRHAFAAFRRLHGARDFVFTLAAAATAATAAAAAFFAVACVRIRVDAGFRARRVQRLFGGFRMCAFAAIHRFERRDMRGRLTALAAFTALAARGFRGVDRFGALARFALLACLARLALFTGLARLAGFARLAAFPVVPAAACFAAFARLAGFLAFALGARRLSAAAACRRLVASTPLLRGAAAAVAVAIAAAFAALGLLAALTTLRALARRTRSRFLRGGRRCGHRSRLRAEQALQPFHETAAARGRGGHGRRRFRRALALRRGARRRPLGRDALDGRFLARLRFLGALAVAGFRLELAGGFLGHLPRCARIVEARIVVTQALELVVRRIEVLVRNQHDADLEARFDLVDFLALLVEQEGRHLDGHLTVDRRGVLLHRFFLNDPQHLQRGRFGVADVARAVAARAGDVAAFGQGRAQALARQLHQAEARDLAHLHARAVVLERVLQALLDFALALGRFHVDEVDHDQAAQVAQT